MLFFLHSGALVPSYITVFCFHIAVDAIVVSGFAFFLFIAEGPLLLPRLCSLKTAVL